jgi:hypothetical protein
MIQRHNMEHQGGRLIRRIIGAMPVEQPRLIKGTPNSFDQSTDSFSAI